MISLTQECWRFMLCLFLALTFCQISLYANLLLSTVSSKIDCYNLEFNLMVESLHTYSLVKMYCCPSLCEFASHFKLFLVDTVAVTSFFTKCYNLCYYNKSQSLLHPLNHFKL